MTGTAHGSGPPPRTARAARTLPGTQDARFAQTQNRWPAAVPAWVSRDGGVGAGRVGR
ncbi:hypothetical protein ACIGXM_31925 [Kitasatospora sp. NPDC052896]|uniref:hypothetical protein n=1 Tax=Kitasatospora sp. NPDC052896 TaxID=3364061 RepID=UPI0037C94B80